jgi:quinolinate synthase
VNLGNYVQRQTGRKNMKIWQGSCIVHNTFPVRRLLDAKAAFPKALVVAHPECPEAVLAHADFIGSTSAIIDYCAASPAREFIVMTESGVNYSLERVAPGAKFHYVANENCNCSECPFMRLNTLEKLRDSLLYLEPRVEVADDLIARSLKPMERMLALP